MGALAALVLPSLTGSTAKLIGIAALVFGIFAGGAFLQHKIDADALDRLRASYAQAQAATAASALKIQQSYDNDAALAAQKDQQNQTALAANTQQFKQEIVRYVPVAKSCVPVGLVSVLRGAIGLSTPNVPAAAVKSDDACSSVGWPDLARAVIDAFGRARANGAQLNALEGFIDQTHKGAPK